MIRVGGMKLFYNILEIVSKVAKHPGRMFLNEKLEVIKGVPAIAPDAATGPGSGDTFYFMGGGLVVVTVQKTKSVELSCPVQHFFLGLFKITDRKCAGSNGSFFMIDTGKYFAQ